MSDLKCARALLDVAEQDILTLRALLAATEVGDGVFGFHVQQAAEKSLRAWLALLGVKFPLTHDLGALVALLRERVGAAAFPTAYRLHPLLHPIPLSRHGPGHADRSKGGATAGPGTMAARRARVGTACATKTRRRRDLGKQ